MTRPYQPSEDSYLLSAEIGKFLDFKHPKPKIALDMGSGTGIQATTLQSAQIKTILCADINPECVKLLQTIGFKSMESDLFSNIKCKFDLIVFNPPYLPETKYDKLPDTTGGKIGNETILRFLEQAPDYLNKKASILLLFSSLSDGKTIIDHANKLGYFNKKLTDLQLPGEKLYVYQFCHKS